MKILQFFLNVSLFYFFPSFSFSLTLILSYLYRFFVSYFFLFLFFLLFFILFIILFIFLFLLSSLSTFYFLFFISSFFFLMIALQMIYLRQWPHSPQIPAQSAWQIDISRACLSFPAVVSLFERSNWHLSCAIGLNALARCYFAKYLHA